MNENIGTQNGIVIERIFNAPVEVIWQMWTQPEHFKKWYGPEGLTVPVAEMDVRVGGKHLVCMERQMPNGSMKMWTTGVYKEVVPHTRLVFTDSMADEDGNLISPAAQGMGASDYPTTTEVTIVLEALNGRTRMVLTDSGMPANVGASEGWDQSFGKLVAYVETMLNGK